MKARQLREHLELGRVDRDIVRAAREDIARLPFYVAALHQKRHRLAPRIERAADHERALGDEKRIFRVGTVDELVFRQAGVHVQLRRGEVRDVIDLCHGCISLFDKVSSLYPIFHAHATVFFPPVYARTRARAYCL